MKKERWEKRKLRKIEGRLDAKKFPKILLEGAAATAVTHFASHPLLPPRSPLLSSPRSSNSSVCLRRRVHDMYEIRPALHSRRYRGSLEREIFEVANLFSRLILQRTFGRYVTLQERRTADAPVDTSVDPRLPPKVSSV